MSVDRDSNTSSPVPNGKSRGLRVTFADSPNGSRPTSSLGWPDRMAEMDIRAQTPPLAGEWAGSNQVKATASSMFSSQKSSSVQTQAFASQSQQSQSQMSSFQSSQSSTFSSVQKSSFSSSQSVKTESIQASKAFEAFPGLGRIENLKIE